MTAWRDIEELSEIIRGNVKRLFFKVKVDR